MRTDDPCLLVYVRHDALHHLVGYRVGEDYHQIRLSDPVREASLIFAEDLGLAAVLLTEVYILSFHTFVAANDHYAHKFSPCTECGFRFTGETDETG